MLSSNLDSVVVDQTIFAHPSVKANIKNPKSFGNSILRKTSGGISSKNARCLQCLCITVFYERVAVAFVEHYVALRMASTSLCSQYLHDHNNVESKFRTVLKFYRHRVFHVFFKTKQREPLSHHSQRVAFQEKFGYFLFAMYLIPRKELKKNAGMSSAVAGKPISKPALKTTPVSDSKKSNGIGKLQESARASIVAAEETENLAQHSSPLDFTSPEPKRQKLLPDGTAPQSVDAVDPGMVSAVHRSIACLVKDVTDDLRKAYKDLQLKYDALRLKLDDSQLKQKETDHSMGELRLQVSCHAEQIERNAQLGIENSNKTVRMLQDEFRPGSVGTLEWIQTHPTNNTNVAFDSVEVVPTGDERRKERKTSAKKSAVLNAGTRTAVATSRAPAASSKRKSSSPKQDVRNVTNEQNAVSTITNSDQELAIEESAEDPPKLPVTCFDSDIDDSFMNIQSDESGS